VACALVDGAVGPDQLLEHGLADPVRQALAARVDVIHDPELEGVFPWHALAWVEVEAAHGRCARSEVLAARGDAEAPLSDDELTSKCTSLAEPVLGPDRARALVGAITALPAAANLSALVALLRPVDRQAAGDRRQAAGDSGRSTGGPTHAWRGRTNVRRGTQNVPERR
jgi:2-methylcitrate dehydratase PrpD